MNSKELPLVSCIMPTYNRRKFVTHAIDYFLRQDYSNKELIIVDDGTDIVEDLVPDTPLIRYFLLSKKITLGAKLNLACGYARGEIIANWDDDDWYANTRLTYQVSALKNDNVEVCGINNLLYYDLQNNRGYRYIYPDEQKTWLLGSSLCYTKKIWCRNPFADINVGMDGLFVWATPPECIKVLPDSTMSVHMIHETNVSPKKTNNKWWHSYPVDELQKIMKEDWNLYINGNAPIDTKISAKHKNDTIPAKDKTKPLRNIYACLVHENEECVLDLVRNLHYLDPSSVILLFNGGNNQNLFSNHHPFNQFGAVIHPNSFPVKYGYLHTFALSCMQFAADNFAFDSFTIVDSDQLAIRPGYSTYLKESFSSAGVGLMSSKPKRLTIDDLSDPQIWPIAQAFKEYDLWKPFLRKFPDGENKFVHWTFWPSTVFSSDAVRDLVKLFRDDILLNNIIKQTKIWATEEVILPTLVAQLGYKIVANPCSYDFVKFKKSFSVRDVELALRKTDAYWIHPIHRQYNDPLRKAIRKSFNYYSGEAKTLTGKSSGELFMTFPLLNKLKKIQGWLTDEEADLLISSTIKACINLPAPHTIAEVGCYHGKSTIIFGSVLKEFSPNGKIYSIDAHDGRLGAVENGLQIYPPSYNNFKKNIEDAGLSDIIESFKGYCYDMKWNHPVSLLFIDGLHDYISVSKDFWHFAKWIINYGYVVFHDYADYFPGVKAFVNDLLKTGRYQQICNVDTLIVIQKICETDFDEVQLKKI